MKRVTQRIKPEAAGDVLEHVPSAHVASVDDRRVGAAPVALRFYRKIAKSETEPVGFNRLSVVAVGNPRNPF
jgi:hypothetical protein